MKKIDSSIKISITHFNDDPLMWAKQPKELPQTQIYKSLYFCNLIGVNLWYFKLSLLNLAEYIVWRIKVYKTEFASKTQFLWHNCTLKRLPSWNPFITQTIYRVSQAHTQKSLKYFTTHLKTPNPKTSALNFKMYMSRATKKYREVKSKAKANCDTIKST